MRMEGGSGGSHYTPGRGGRFGDNDCMLTHFVLVHSPLVGPETWSLVAESLRSMGQAALVPALPLVTAPGRPYWALHAQAVAEQAAHLASQDLVLVGHSGAGALLPAMARAPSDRL